MGGLKGESWRVTEMSNKLKHSPLQTFVLPLNGVYMIVQERGTLGLVLLVGLNEKYRLVGT